jgi:excisionase family DNA binding protein
MAERLTMTVTETADALGISRNTAYQLVRKGDIPSVRLGRRLVIPKTALNAWLERQADRKHQ